MRTSGSSLFGQAGGRWTLSWLPEWLSEGPAAGWRRWLARPYKVEGLISQRAGVNRPAYTTSFSKKNHPPTFLLVYSIIKMLKKQINQKIWAGFFFFSFSGRDPILADNLEHKMLLVTSWERRWHIRQVHHHSVLSLWDSPSHCDNFHTNSFLFLRNMSCNETVLFPSLSLWPFSHLLSTFVPNPLCVSNGIYQHFTPSLLKNKPWMFTSKLNCMFICKWKAPGWHSYISVFLNNKGWGLQRCKSFIFFHFWKTAKLKRCKPAAVHAFHTEGQTTKLKALRVVLFGMSIAILTSLRGESNLAFNDVYIYRD